MRVKLIGCQPKPFTFSSYLTEQGFFSPQIYPSGKMILPVAQSSTLRLNKSCWSVLLARSPLQHGDIHGDYFVIMLKSCEINLLMDFWERLPLL